MASFWKLSRHLLHERVALVCAIVFAFLSAGGLAAGLLSLAPMLTMILNPEAQMSLADLAREFNAQDNAFDIPVGVIDRLPIDPFQGVVLILGGIVVLTVLGGVANFMHQYLSQTVTTRAIARIRYEAFDHVLHLPLARVVTRGPTEFVARIVRDTAEFQRGLIALLSKAVTHLFKGLAALTVAFIVDWRLTMVAVPTALIVGIIIRKLGKRIKRGSRKSLKAQEGLLRIASEMLQGLRAVKANTGEEEAIERFEEMNQEAVRHDLKVRSAKAFSQPVVETLATFLIVLVALVAAKAILAGLLPIERFTLTLASLGVAGASLRPLTGLITEVQIATAPAERLIEIMGGEREYSAGDRKAEAPRHSRSVEFEHVSFTYPGASRTALDDITLNILHGERVAIVGPNGCGKTTLLSLLPRLIQPIEGRVLIDGVDIADVNLRSLRRQIGVVTQETVLFRGTIASNIAFGMDGVSREQVVKAAKQAHADQFIQRLPGKYDADVLEQGASLSGGERQRLAIARAILRDPSILILDEATSQIDAESEEQINLALEEFCQTRTALIIAHRLSTVLQADRIVVMANGRVIDQGRHDQLLENCEEYRRLNRTQLLPSA